MKFSVKSIVPHLIAVIIFIAVSVFFCRPALKNDASVRQSDMTHVDGLMKQLNDYEKIKGHYSNWNPYSFSGMPSFVNVVGGERNFLDKIGILQIDSVFQLFLPQPFNYFFLCCICFYIMCMCFKIKPHFAIIGSLGYAFCTYNPILISVGHITKMLALGYAPALIGAVYLLLSGRFILGFVLSALFAALQLKQGHPQISYYLFIIIGFMVLAFLIDALKNKNILSFIKPVGLLILAATIGVLSNAIPTLVVMDYGKESKRGGQLVMDDSKLKGTKVENGRTKGLDRDYAFQWSYGIGETLTLAVPGINGYGSPVPVSDGNYFPSLDDDSKLYNYLTSDVGIDGNQASGFVQNIGSRMYWGDQPFTQGPVYLGAALCALFIFGLFFIDKKHLYWIVPATIFGILLSWGKNLPSLNNFLFDYLPYYNKLRAPSMALVIPQILFPIGAVLGLQKIIDSNIVADNFKKYKHALIAMGAVVVLLVGVYFMASYTNENKQLTKALSSVGNQNLTQTVYDSINAKYTAGSDNMLRSNIEQALQGDETKVNGVMNALKKDRASLYAKDLMLSLFFFALIAALLFLLIKNKLNLLAFSIITALVVFIDLYRVDVKYLNENNFESKEGYVENNFAMQPYDKEILQDKDPNFRVFNIASGDPFQESNTGYFHKSLGGYHPMKIGIYDDLYTHQLSGNINQQVLNMLNTKYIIQKNQADAKAAPIAYKNPDALGNAWFVKNIKYVPDAREEMRALNNLNTKDSAVAQKDYEKMIGSFGIADSTESIKQTAFDNDEIYYESNTKDKRLAVFSEIFYKDWNAYIDGVKTPIAKVNYALRGLVIPAGKHKIDFKFEPSIVTTSLNLSRAGNISLLLIVLGYLVWLFLKRKKD